MNTATCPYCENECDMDSFENDCAELDWECEHCGKEFQIEVEYDPYFHASKIIIKTCQACNKKTREFGEKGKRYPFPKTPYETLCDACYAKMMFVEIAANKKEK